MEIKEELSKVLTNMKLPPQIQNTIKELYLEYQHSYKKLIEYLKAEYPNKETLKIELETLEDYKEDIQMTETIEYEEYEQRRTIIIEVINNILKSARENRSISVEKFDNDMLEALREKKNKDFTKMIIENTISEIESSSKYLLNKINHIGLKRDEDLEILEQQFIEEIKSIKDKMPQKSSEINQIIDEHFISIYRQLKSIIETYRNEIEHEKVKNTTNAGKREDDIER